MSAHPHFNMGMNPPSYQGYPPQPSGHYNIHPHQKPMSPPPQSPGPQMSPPPLSASSPPPPQSPGKASEAKPEKDNKAKSRLSNLIQAMADKVKAKETPASPADQILNKWQLAFQVKPPTPTKETEADQSANQSASDVLTNKTPAVSDKSSGYLTPMNIASGVKILLMKNHLFYSACVVCISGNNVCGVKFKNNTFSDIQYFSETDLIRTSVLEREIVNGMTLDKGQRVVVASKNNLETFTIGSIVDFRNGVYIVQMDKGGFEEANAGNLRILPRDYPKNRSFQAIEEKPKATVEAVSKHKHKHNILLGYDFVDENDTDIVAWDRAIQRKKKIEKTKSVSPPLPDIKQEAEEEVKPEASEEDIKAEVNQSVQSMVDQVTLEDKMRISLLSNMFKKHSPKKPPGSKSPKQGVEIVKKEKKRKKSKDNISKRLSLEDDDLSSELLSICKESNIDISKPSNTSPDKEQSNCSVKLEDKIQEIAGMLGPR